MKALTWSWLLTVLATALALLALLLLGPDTLDGYGAAPAEPAAAPRVVALTSA